ncbi:MAG: hypothetical protein F2562_05580, partial [Actinobacteria bacterium]|nr:hypothetical protein [Actinomycetota bacterium]
AGETIAVPAVQTAAFNSSVTVGAAPTRTGHTFAGWNTAANGTGTALSAGASYTVTATSPTLFAQWTVNSYMVSYNANGGSGAPTASTVQFGVTATVAAAASNPSRTGHTFASWTTNADGTGSSYAPSATFTMGAANVALFAKWTVNNYTVSYDDNVISAVITVPSTQSAAYAGSVTVGAAPTRTGHTFAGWNTAANGSGTSYSAGANLTIPASNTVLYAQWTVNTYNVSYNLNGGSGTAPVAQSGDFDTSITAASTSSTRTGFTFNGWNTAADGTGGTVAALGSYTIPAANTTLFAQWTANQYTVTFAANDDVANAATGLPANITGRTYQQSITLPSVAPSRTNYVFSGWNTAAAGTGVSYAAGGAYVMPNNSVTLHAQWTPASFGVVYNANGGITPPPPTNNDFGSTVTVSTTRPTRTGHTFLWWTDNANGNGTTYRNPALGSTVSTFTMPGSQVTLFAQWEVNSYNLTYDANLGSNAPSGQSVAFNATATASVSAPTRAGYQFNGWNTIADGSGTTYAAGGTFLMPAANVTLYAQWQAITYNLAYNTNGGDSAAPTAQTATTDSSVTVSATIPTRAGYDFAGWNTQMGGFGTPRTSGGTFVMPASNVTLFAQWNAQTLSISYNGNGGTGIPTGQSGLVDSSVTISSATPTRTGYTFAGWNTAADGSGTSRTSGSTFVMPTVAFVLYAQWQAINYSVSYEANNGTGAPSSSSHTYLDTVTLSATVPTRAGYWFNGWNTSSDGSGMAHTSAGNLTMPAVNVTLYAQWVADLYRVVYNANGGEDAPAEQVLATDSFVLVSSQEPTRVGHEFRHWTTTQNGTGSTYTNPATGSAVDNFSMPPNNTTLFAQWSVLSYVLSYDANLGAGAPSGGSTQFGASVAVSSTVPTRTGHTFTGWNTAANGSGVSYVAGNTLSMPASAVTLFAQWSAKTYSITYFANGGASAPAAQSVTYGSTTSVSATPATRAGYTFSAWNTQASGQGATRSPGGSLVMSDSNIDLYAQWTAQSFNVSFDANGGADTPTVVSGATDSSVTLPVSVPTRVGFDFVGWNTLQAGTGTGYQAGSSLVMPPNNMVLWAQWQPRTYVLSYDLNGGTTNPPIGALASTSSSVQAAASTPTRVGYTFTGWNTQANGQGIAAASGASFSMPPNDTTLYAQWSAQTFTVTYDANGGSGGPSQQNATTDSSVTVSSVVPTRSGFTFAGWNTTIGGTGTNYSTSASFTMPPDNVALWAQWTANPTPPAPQLPPAPRVLTPPAAPTIPSGRSTTLSPLAEAPPAGDEWDRPTMGVFAIDSVSSQDVRTAQSSAANTRVSRLETSAGVWSTDTQSGTVSFVARSTFSGQARVGFAVTTRRGVEYTSVLTVDVTRPATLPVSGSESSTPLTLAVWVLVTGILVSALVRRRTILR